jgi:hypothetical protein
MLTSEASPQTAEATAQSVVKKVRLPQEKPVRGEAPKTGAGVILMATAGV